MFIKHLCDIFDEVKRVLKPTGTCFVNLGDTYSQSGGAGSQYERFKGKNRIDGFKKYDGHKVKNMPPKCLVQIPFRFSIEMVNRGWTLRNTIIWNKLNALPSPVTDRFTVDMEYIFFFVKNKKYYFEQQFEKYTGPMNRWGGVKLKAEGKSEWDEGTGQSSYRTRSLRPNLLGRNKRCVWRIPTKPLKGAHFATFPEALVIPMIRAGCPEFICNKCGKPREKIYESDWKSKRKGTWKDAETRGKKMQRTDSHRQALAGGLTQIKAPSVITFKGYSECGCSAGFHPGICLDPFMGAGTTAVVAKKVGRNYLGFELSKKYVIMAETRLKGGDAVAMKHATDENQQKLGE